MSAYLYWTDSLGATKILYFDAVTESSHQLQSEVVEHQVEIGVDVTDHIRPKVPRVTLSTFVSNHPIVSQDEIGAKIASTGGPVIGELVGVQKGSVTGQQLFIPQVAPTLQPNPQSIVLNILSAVGSALVGAKTYNVNVLTFDQEFDNVKDVYQALEKARIESQLFNIVTTVRTYSSMALEDFNLTNSAGNSGGMFHLELKQVRLVSAKSVTLPKPKEVNATTTINKGAKNTKEVYSSVAFKGIKAGGDWVGVDIFQGYKPSGSTVATPVD